MKRSTTKTLLIMVASAFIISATLGGCSQKDPKTLENIIEKNGDAKESIEKSISAMENEEMTVTADYKGNDIIINSTLETVYTDDVLDQLKDSFDESSKSTENTYIDVIRQIEETAMLKGVQIRLMINNGDGKLIWEETYNRDGMVD